MAGSATTQKSNSVGGRIAEEATPCVLPATPVWYPIEPNEYADFGAEITTAARTPISEARQNKKGVVVDLDASGGYTQDFTETGFLRGMQGFLFADAREQADTQPLNGAAVVITSTTMTSRTIAATGNGLDVFAANDLVLLSGFGQAATNGLKLVATAAAAAITLDASTTIGASEVAPPASARVKKVGVRADTNDLAIVKNGNQVSITSSTLDFTTLGLIAGSWIFIADDFTNAVNQNVYARVDVIAANAITLGKTSKTMVAESAGPAVDIFLPTIIRNEPDAANIVERTYQIERTLGRDANGVQSEYLIGSMANEFTLTTTTAEIITADLAYVSADYETRDGTTGVKSGTRPALVSEDGFNSTTDVRRARLSLVEAGNPNPDALFAYATDYDIGINNNIAPNKAITKLGAISMNVGQFDVSGSLEVYFNTVDALAAVRNNSDATFDVVMAKNNIGWVIDMPLISLGNGRLTVALNEPIKVPLDQNAAESDLGHTLLIGFFPYLPDGA